LCFKATGKLLLLLESFSRPVGAADARQMMLGSAVSQWSRTENGRSLHSPGGRWAFLFAIVVSALVSTTDEASSQPVDPGAKLQFDMPMQPLASALSAFGVTTRLELFYESTLIESHRSPSIRGVFSPDVALRLLLEGTGLSVASFEPGTMTILPPPPQPGSGTELAKIKGKGLVLNSTDPNKGYKVIDSSSSGYCIVMPVSTFKKFHNEKILPNMAAIRAAYVLPTPPVPPVPTTTSAATVVRTGTGDISMAANGDIKLNGGASIYTAGRRDLAVFSDFTTAPVSVSYGIGGGHLSIAAGGNIDVALPTDRSLMQHYAEWLKRQGVTDGSYVFGHYNQGSSGLMPAQQSSWWVDYGNFQRGVGALGGGNVDVSAGGDLVNLTVALPTNARVRGGRSITERKLLELRNGGAMTVEAGGVVRAGYYYVGRGAGTIEAGEFAIGREVKALAGTQLITYPIAPILSLGDATLDVRTAGDLRLQTFLDPLLVGKGVVNEPTFMSSQTERTAISLTSTGGDVILIGQATYLSKDVTTVSEQQAYGDVNLFAGNIYPSKTRVTALKPW
jgi:hypothetical protein